MNQFDKCGAGERMKLVRLANNISLKSIKHWRLAQIHMVTENMVYEVEAGNNKPQLRHIEAMCEWCGVTADYILFGIEEGMPEDQLEAIDLVRKAAEKTGAWRLRDHCASWG